MKKSFLSLISVALVYVFSATVVSCSNYESPLTGQKVSDIVMEETEGFFARLNALGENSNVRFVLNVSCDIEELPAFIRQYVI